MRHNYTDYSAILKELLSDAKRRWVDNITLELKEISVPLDNENTLFVPQNIF
jgi:hypothetical protein